MRTKTNLREIQRVARHRRIRKTVTGTDGRPRLCIHRSLKNFYAQVVDDTNGKILFGISTLNKKVRGKIKNGGNIEAAKLLGETLAAEVKGKGIAQVCFDRGGCLYHGRIKAFADAARKGGLEF